MSTATTLRPSNKKRQACRIIEELEQTKASLAENLPLCQNDDKLTKEGAKAIKDAEKSILELVIQRDACDLLVEEDHTAGPQAGLFVKRSELKKFGGDAKEWPSWYETIRVGVLENNQFDDIGRAIKIKDLVTADAAITIKEVAPTAANLPLMLTMLATSHGNPQKIIQSLEAELDGIPILKVGDPRPSGENVRRVFNRITSLINALKHAGAAKDERGMVRHLFTRIPRSVCKDAMRRIPVRSEDLEINLEKLLEAMKEEVVLDEVFSTYRGEGKDTPEESVVPTLTTLMGKADGKKRSASSGPGNPKKKKQKNEGKEKKSRKCSFCEGNHGSKACTAYGTYDARKTRLMQSGKCFRCLTQGHRALSCPKKDELKCDGCGVQGHLVPMCTKQAVAGDDKGKCTFLQTFYCVIGSEEGARITVKGILDPCSNASHVHERLLKTLGLVGGPRTEIKMQTFQSESSTLVETRVVEVIVTGREGKSRRIKVYTTSCVTGGGRLNPPPDMAAQILPLNLDYADPDLFTQAQRPVELLIGADEYHNFVNVMKTRRLAPNLVLYDTIFGLVPSGGGIMPTREKIVTTLQANKSPSTSKELPTEDLERMWELDVLGIQPRELEPAEPQVLELFRKTTRRIEGRFEVCLPWKRERNSLQTHHRMCLARLRALIRSHEKSDGAVLRECNNILADQETKGVIERAPRGSPGTIHYVPHKAIMQNGKVRMVFDGSANTSSGRSLNDHLHAGPVMTQNLCGILINFRLRKIAILADIEKAFLQVGLSPIDRDVVRFLWAANPSKPLEGTNVIYYRFARVPFGLNCSPYLLNIVLNELLSEFEDAKERSWFHKLYVDNLVISVNTYEEVSQLYHKLTAKLAEGRFNLRDWMSNDQKAIDLIPAHHRAEKVEITKVLGMGWDTKMDRLSLRFEERDSPEIGTLEEVLSDLASVYDPMGLVAPCLLDMKLLVQECHKQKLGWKDNLNDELMKEYRKTLIGRNQLKAISIPRRLWLVETPLPKYELHVFSDASERAFGCAVYLVNCSNDGSVGEATLVFSKLRVAPYDQKRKKKRTIPELELMGAVVGKRSVSFVKNHIDVPISKTVLWVDATTVLHWLHSTKMKEVFVQNRLIEIRSSSGLEVRYVPTEENPADLVSRGTSGPKLARSDLWWHGPAWLSTVTGWPAAPDGLTPFKTTLLAVKPEISDNVLSRKSFGWCKKTQTYRGCLLEERWSDWNKYIRMFQIVLALYFKVKKVESTDERREIAERVLIRLMQRKYFSDDISRIQSKTQLRLFTHDGVIRHRSRLPTNAHPFEEACPALLPRPHFEKNTGSQLVLVLIRHLHVENCHLGVSHLLSKFRERYWVDQARSLMKSVVHRCSVCRRWTGGSYQRPRMDPLPTVRVYPIVPFMNTGVDYFGPVMVTMKLPPELLSEHGEHYYLVNTSGLRVRPKPAYQKDGVLVPHQDIRVRTKVYVCIFVCLVTRAVHLELAEDLTGDQFLLALDRFVNRYIKPKAIVSDNGTNFRFIQPFLGPEVTWEEHQFNSSCFFPVTFRSSDGTIEHLIDWHFIPAHSPWYGGVYERMIGVVKRSLNKALGDGRSLVDQVVLSTALTKVANIVNSRPLTYTSSDEVVQPLTPNHFLKPAQTADRGSLEIPRGQVPSRQSNMLQGWRHVTGLVENYRQAFHKEYFTALRDVQVQHHRHPRGSRPMAPSPGDVVLIKDDNAPRASWPIGVVDAVSDRTADLTVAQRFYGTMKPGEAPHLEVAKSKVTKTFDKLYPLELRYENDPISAPAAGHDYAQN